MTIVVLQAREVYWTLGLFDWTLGLFALDLGLG